MRAERKRLVRWVGLIILGLGIVQAAMAVKAEGAATVVPLTPLTPGAMLVVTSCEAGTFDLEAVKNKVIFVLQNKQTKMVTPQFSDGRTIVVKVPDQAGSGIIAFQKGETTISTLDLSVTAPTSDYMLITAFPVIFFLLFLLWLGISLKKDPAWHLGDALSEQMVEKVAVLDEHGKPEFNVKDGIKEPIYYEKVKYGSSSSRLIAFIGLFVLASGILATLVPAVYRFALTGEAPDMGNFSTYLLAQTGIFAPYVTNKIVEGVKGPGASQGTPAKA